MQEVKRFATAMLLVTSTTCGAQAVEVTDELGRASFRGCYFLTCMPGVSEPVGLESVYSQWDRSEGAIGLGLTAQYSSESLPILGSSGGVVPWLGVQSITRAAGSNAFLSARLNGSITYEATSGGSGRVQLTDIRVDGASNTIYADVRGLTQSSAQGAYDLSLQDVPLWSFSGVSGPGSHRSGWLGWGEMPIVSVYTVGDLAMTAEGAAALATGFGWGSSYQLYAQALPWGDLRLSLYYGHEVTGVPAIPEPSSVLLCLAGLVAAAAAIRRRA